MLSRRLLDMNVTLNLGKNIITNVGYNISELDVVNITFSDNNYIRIDSDDIVRGDLSARSKKYVNLSNPVNGSDSSTQQYLDTKTGTEGSQVIEGSLEVDRLIANNTTDFSYTKERAYNTFLKSKGQYNHDSLIVEGRIGVKSVINLSENTGEICLAKLSDINLKKPLYSKIRISIKDIDKINDDRTNIIDDDSDYTIYGKTTEDDYFLKDDNRISYKNTTATVSISIYNQSTGSSTILTNYYHKFYSPNFLPSNLINIQYYAVEDDYMLLLTNSISNFAIMKESDKKIVSFDVTYPILNYEGFTTPNDLDFIEIGLVKHARLANA